VLWATSSRVTSQALQFFGTLVLARLLDPRAFGVVAISNVFTGFANLYSDLGLGAVLVRAKRLSNELITTAFYLNLIGGVLLALVVCGLSVPLAGLYGEHQLILVMCVGSIQICVNVTVVPLAILERAFRFRLLAIVEIGSAIIGLTAVITMATNGFGPVSIVVGPVVMFTIQGVALWATVRIWPSGGLTRKALHEIRVFSGPIVLFNSLIYWARTVDNLLLGAVAGAAVVGLYTRAYALMLLPVQQVTVVLSRVLMPTLARHRDVPADMRASYLRALRLSSAVTIPAGFGVMCLAVPIVAVLFGPHWQRMDILVEILAASTGAQVIATTTGAIFQALGETRLWSRMSLVAAGVTVAALSLGVSDGATGVAIAFSASTYGLSYYLLSRPWRLLGLPFRAGLQAIAPSAAAASIMTLVLVAFDGVAHRLPAALWLFSGVLIGLVSYLASLYLLDRSVVHEWLRAVRRATG
jgi:O-antigen/teichoic acid export membrane protein